MSECNHDCGSCAENCESRENVIPKEELHPMSSVKKVIAVMSGKGGVGKSLITSLLAVLANKKGNKTAIMDADITGPSIPKSFGLHDKAFGSEVGIFPVVTDKGIDVMSLNLLVDNETDPVIWRGPVISGTVSQFWTEVVWDGIDYMFIDMPPGTGDVPLTVLQSFPVDGIIIVTSPQELVSMIVEKAVKMAEIMEIPIVGIVENMSYFVCPDCGKQHNIFGESHVDDIAAEYGIKAVAKLPIDPSAAGLCDKGKIEEADTSALEDIFGEIEKL